MSYNCPITDESYIIVYDVIGGDDGSGDGDGGVDSGGSEGGNESTSYVDVIFNYPDSEGVMSSRRLSLAVGCIYEIRDTAIVNLDHDTTAYSWSTSSNAVLFEECVESFYSGVIPTGETPYEFEATLNISEITVYFYDDSLDCALDIYFPDSDYSILHERLYLPQGTLLEFTNNELWIVGHAEPLMRFPLDCNAYSPISMTSHDSSRIPMGSLPFEIEINSNMVISIYVFEKKLSAPIISYNAVKDTISFRSVDEDAYYRAIIKYPDGTEQIRSIPRGYYEFAPYDVVDKVGEVTIFVQAFVTYDRYTTSSERSNGFFWTAAAPVIEEFYIEENILHYKFSGIRTVGSLQQNGRNIVENITPGTYVYEINLDGGLYGFTLTAENKYGITKSDLVDYYVGFANDTNGTFYSVGVIMNEIVEMLDSISFFGISLWMMLCTSFIITIVIPFICIFVLPSFGGGMITRGGNNYSRSKCRNDNGKDDYVDKKTGEVIERHNK